ncbi:hypothetical protein IP92_04881 [Pseudoduganella flava]|uniref:Uncharacterized protein n=1 Tax=Pseudoduganella flava TaxID=871742 RepID=A0A562PHB5_9BURK|nr:hypothetical protein [Pseudoduganella flava]QGZ42664.1 hypothetical protein GO485_28945 [Pseudoduganella flava]TWI43827.1 hypothetical protein IP92_04881 [Pseudoduganella flava]
MEFRFKFTKRLVVLGVLCAVALVVLLLALGFQIGVRMAAETAGPALPAPLERATPAPKAAP